MTLMLPSGCAMLYYMHDTPMFLQPQIAAHREKTLSYYMFDAQLVLWTQNITHSTPQFNSPTQTYQGYYKDNSNICNVHQFQTQ